MRSVIPLRAASFRALKPRLFDSVIPLELVEALKERYQFRQVPTLQQPSFAGASFSLGKVRRRGRSIIVIEELTVTYLGTHATIVGASTRTSTADADYFLRDLADWIGGKYGLDKREILPPAYQSQLEVVFGAPISRHFERLSEVGQAVTKFVTGYGLKDCPRFEFGGFWMHFDTSKVPPSPTPVRFSLERRVGAAYGENKYFSEAPLRSEDHRRVLELVEAALEGSQ